MKLAKEHYLENGGRINARYSRIIDIREAALNNAFELMEVGCEPRSALKQAAADLGVKGGKEMSEFVLWAETQF